MHTRDHFGGRYDGVAIVQFQSVKQCFHPPIALTAADREQAGLYVIHSFQVKLASKADVISAEEIIN